MRTREMRSDNNSEMLLARSRIDAMVPCPDVVVINVATAVPRIVAASTFSAINILAAVLRVIVFIIFCSNFVAI